MDELDSIEHKNISKFSLNGLSYIAKVVKVYDGDTITVVFKFNDAFFKWNCRLIGIDTPELKTTNKSEKEIGIKARDYLKSLIMDKIVKIKCGEFDKYGRLLVEVFINDTNINENMIQGGYAKKYLGGTKEIW